MLQAIPSTWEEYIDAVRGRPADRARRQQARAAIDAEFVGLPLRVLTILRRMAVLQGPFTAADVAATPDRVLLRVCDMGPKRLALLRAHVPYREPDAIPAWVCEGSPF